MLHIFFYGELRLISDGEWSVSEIDMFTFFLSYSSFHIIDIMQDKQRTKGAAKRGRKSGLKTRPIIFTHYRNNFLLINILLYNLKEKKLHFKWSFTGHQE